MIYTKVSDKLAVKSSNIDLLRFAAAILVIISHAPVLGEGATDLCYQCTGGQCNFGGLAVAVFFFLSGIYVTNSMYKCDSIKSFLYKRCKRIFPQLWIVVLLTVLVLGPVFTTLSPSAYLGNSGTWKYLLNGILVPVHELPGVFANAHNTAVNGALWTLPVEAAAYIVLALVWSLVRILTKNQNVKLQTIFHGAGTLLLICGLVFVQYKLPDNEMLVSIIRPVILFFIGSLYADLKEKIRINYPIGILFLALLLAALKTPFFNYALIFFLPYVIVSLVMGTKQIPVKCELFAIAYEMYLIGFPIQQIIAWCAEYGMPAWMNACIAIPIDIAGAFVLYKLTGFLEKRVQ